jgi:thymidylate kinase
MEQIPVIELGTKIHETTVGLKAPFALFQSLNESGIRYCLWKSNIRQEQGMSGETDLDLLVERGQSAAFRHLLQEHNVKPFHAAPGRNYPAMENYLGFDDETGRLFHLHVHYHLVLGEQFVKNYRLPLEDHFLDSVQLRYGAKLPSPELEIIILSIRILLKYRERELLRDIFPYRSTGISASFRKEIQWLLEQTSRDRIERTLVQISEIVPADLILAFLDIALTGRKAGLKLYFLRNRLRRTLSLFQRTNPFSAILRYFGEMWDRRKFLRSSPVTKMTLPAGGLTLALIGADGAGKSTLCKALTKWLSWKLDTQVYYLGSKLPSGRSRLLYSVYRVFRRLHQALASVSSEKNFICRPFAGLRDVFLYWHHLSLAQDRHERYLTGLKKSMAGSLVIFDRYPLESLDPQIGVGHMDGSKIAAMLGKDSGAVARFLARTERALYDRIRPPDYLAILNVSPEVSLQRKPDHKQDVVEAKSLLIRQMTALAESESRGLQRIHLNADLPFEEVFQQLKRNVWEIL